MSIINAREDARDRQLSQITVLLERIASASASSQNLAALAAGDLCPGAALAAAPPPATPPQAPRLAPAESAADAPAAAARLPPPAGRARRGRRRPGVAD